MSTEETDWRCVLLAAFVTFSLQVVVKCANSVYAEEANVLARMESAVIDPGFQRLLREQPDLCLGGSQQFTEGQNWMIIGIGRAALTTEVGKGLTLSDATKVARTKAHRNLAELINGIQISGKDLKVTKSIERDGKSKIVDFFRSVSESTVAATISRAEVVGTWKFDGGNSVCVMVAIANPNHPWLTRRPALAKQIKLEKEEWTDGWRDVFVSRPAMLKGGASVYQTSEKIFLLTVGKARRKGDVATDRNCEIVALSNATREARQFIEGVQVRSHTQATQDEAILTAEETTVLNEVHETFRSMRSESVSGVTRGLKHVGHWVSPDGLYYYAGFVSECDSP